MLTSSQNDCGIAGHSLAGSRWLWHHYQKNLIAVVTWLGRSSFPKVDFPITRTRVKITNANWKDYMCANAQTSVSIGDINRL